MAWQYPLMKKMEKYDIIIDIDDRYYTIGDAVRGVVGYLEEKEISDTEEKRESEV